MPDEPNNVEMPPAPPLRREREDYEGDRPRSRHVNADRLLDRQYSRTAKLEAERDAEREQTAALKKEVAALAAELKKTQERADTNLHAKEADRLKAELRSLRHHAKFDELAINAGLRKEALADAWSLTGYQPESDEIDAGKLTDLIEAQKATRPYLFAPPADPNAPPPPTPPKPGPASGKGGGAPVFSSPVGVDLDRAATDAAYAWKHRDKVVAATRAKLESEGRL